MEIDLSPVNVCRMSKILLYQEGRLYMFQSPQLNDEHACPFLPF